MPDTATPINWTAVDSEKASAQGWDVFACDGGYQMQRDAESNSLLTIDAAAACVRGRASLGDDLAQKAISHLASCGSDDIPLSSLA